MAAATEWRTPPLWGVADSAPYLHDGRAQTLDIAIATHDGEAAKTAARFRKLAPSDRKAVLAFLSSLTVRAERKKPEASGRKQGKKAASAATAGSHLGAARAIALASGTGG